MTDSKKICIVTACGNKKHDVSMRAWQLYKSPRIKAVYNRRMDKDMYILSAEHGLLFSEKVIEPYNRIMDESRVEELVPQLVPIVAKYDTVIYFKAGARGIYEQCLGDACKKAGKKMISFGYSFMGDIGSLQDIVRKESE